MKRVRGPPFGCALPLLGVMHSIFPKLLQTDSDRRPGKPADAGGKHGRAGPFPAAPRRVQEWPSSMQREATHPPRMRFSERSARSTPNSSAPLGRDRH
jgi:hypothetical protein